MVGEEEDDRALGQAVLGEFSKLPNVSTAALRRCPGPLMHVTLEWRTASWRDETVRHQMPPLDASALDALADCDGVHVNFIHGTEIRARLLTVVIELRCLAIHSSAKRRRYQPVKSGTRITRHSLASKSPAASSISPRYPSRWASTKGTVRIPRAFDSTVSNRARATLPRACVVEGNAR